MSGTVSWGCDTNIVIFFPDGEHKWRAQTSAYSVMRDQETVISWKLVWMSVKSYQSLEMSELFALLNDADLFPPFPPGTIHAIFEKGNNHYTWKKVTTTVHNIIVGKLWIDQVRLTELKQDDAF